MDQQQEQQQNTGVLATFKPNTAGRIRYFFNIFIAAIGIGIIVAMLAVWGLPKIISIPMDITNLVLMVAVGYVVVMAVVSIIRAATQPSTFSIYADKVVANNAYKSHEYFFSDYMVSGYSMTNYVNGIPIHVDRKVKVTPKVGNDKVKEISANGYSKGNFSKVINGLNYAQEVLDAKKRDEYLQANEIEAPTSPIVRTATSSETPDILHPDATYAIVTDPALFKPKRSVLVVSIVLLVMGIGMWLAIRFLDVDIDGFVPFFLLIAGVIGVLVHLFGGKKKNVIMGAEISPNGLVLNLSGNVPMNYSWDRISHIQVTPPNYSGAAPRTITITTPEGANTFTYGMESDNKLRENYIWLIEYLKLHAVNRLDYFIR